jgi:hypothetical protein
MPNVIYLELLQMEDRVEHLAAGGNNFDPSGGELVFHSLNPSIVVQAPAAHGGAATTAVRENDRHGRRGAVNAAVG